MSWDLRKSSKPSLRSTLADDYKGTRDAEANADANSANHIIEDLLTSMGIPSIYPGRSEADDVIAYASRLKTFSVHDPFIIMSADSDLLQLITDRVQVWSPIKKIMFTKTKFMEDFGFSPDRYAYYKSLVGDKADNIQGIDGVGPKTAKRIVTESSELSSDHAEIVNRNLGLIELEPGKKMKGDDGREWMEEYSFIKEQLQSDFPQPDWDRFNDICEEWGFEDMLNKSHEWHETFFQKSKMANIVELLYGSTK